MGVWIEISSLKLFSKSLKPSLPVWECGLKFMSLDTRVTDLKSLPVWECGLKLLPLSISQRLLSVTPCVGVWIEISMNSGLKGIVGGSLPVWECGLKSA